MVKNDSNYDDQLVELLNEYLDGSLNPSQVQEVEKRLVEDPLVRQLFVELKQVNKMVRDLPRVSAPEDLAGQIRMQLERNVLFGIEQSRGDSAGHLQLHLRRWLSIAAMLVLTGAVALIIYSVLIGPITIPTQNPGTIADNPTQQGAELVVPNPELPEPPMPQYTLAHLEIRSDNQAANQEKLAALLTALNIPSQQQSPTETGYAEFAVKCRSDQLANIFQTFQKDPNQHIDLILVEENTGAHTTVENIGITPMITLARQSDPQIKTEIMQAVVAGTFTEDSKIEDLSPTLRQAYLQAQPPLDLMVLGQGNTAQPETKDPNTIEEPAVVSDPNSVVIVIEEPNKIPTATIEPEPELIDIKISIKLDPQTTRPTPEIK